MKNISCRRERAVHPLKNLAMNVSESKAESFDPTCPMNEMLWEQEYQEEKNRPRHDSNNPERPKLSCDDRDECAGDNGGEDKTQIAK